MALVRGLVRTDVVVVQTATHIELLPSLAAAGLQPQCFVRNAAAWPIVQASAFGVAQMIELVQHRNELALVPTLEKMWAEAIYEAVRRRVLPDAPSRLDCLYAVQMGYDAFDILPELGLTRSTFGPSGFPVSGPTIIPARTSGCWVPVDMHLFQTAPPLAPDEAAIMAALDTTERLAEHYWTGGASTAPITELLCDGLDVDGWAGYSAPPPLS
jgi:hypothetical protein